jgi:hypothetical protein
MKEKQLMLEYFLQHFPNDCTKKKPFQLYIYCIIRLVLRDLNCQTPLYADCILKY